MQRLLARRSPHWAPSAPSLRSTSRRRSIALPMIGRDATTIDASRSRNRRSSCSDFRAATSRPLSSWRGDSDAGAVVRRSPPRRLPVGSRYGQRDWSSSAPGHRAHLAAARNPRAHSRAATPPASRLSRSSPHGSSAMSEY